ncbi:MAG TPA: zinc metallopeptidase [Anaerolineae bacterium]
MFFDPMYFVFIMPALLLALYAQWRVRSAYSHWLRVSNARNLTGADAARYLLSANQLGDVTIEDTPGELTDHYDPRRKTLRLSKGVASSRSVASLAIVAHEVGHAVQDATAYAPLQLRGAIVPAITISSYIGPLLFFIGLLLRSMELAWLGVIFFGGTVVFSLLTLPVELNASSRAIAMLRNDGLVTTAEEEGGARSVLSAAALTYIAFLAQTLLTLLYYISILSGSRRR